MLQFAGTTLNGEASGVYPPLLQSDVRYRGRACSTLRTEACVTAAPGTRLAICPHHGKGRHRMKKTLVGVLAAAMLFTGTAMAAPSE